MSNQNSQKKEVTNVDLDANKFKDIEDAIQKAIKTESGKIENKNKNKTNTA